MSGRLIISSKKGYCPWNAQNLSRVESDEKEHVRKLLVSRARLVSAKKDKERFSLFELEERKSLLRPNDNSRQKEHNNSITKIHGGENGFMERRKSSKSEDRYNHAMRKEIPFYLLARPTEKALGVNEINRKRQMDPMKDFHQEHEVIRNTSETNCNKGDHNEESSRKRYRARSQKASSDRRRSFPEDDDTSSTNKIEENHNSRKSKKKKGHKKKDRFKNSSRVRCKKEKRSNNADVSNSSESTGNYDFEFVEQLRKKRSEREQKERRRQDAILENSPCSPRDRNNSNEGYSDQFNSAFNDRRRL